MDRVSRIIMLLYGLMDHGGPFWCYVAVKPSMYSIFNAAEASGAIDLYNFEFGEVIVSSEGRMPPLEVTAKVAELYGADLERMFEPINPLEEIRNKMTELYREEGASGDTLRRRAIEIGARVDNWWGDYSKPG